MTGASDSAEKPARAPRKKRIPPYAKFPTSGARPAPPSEGGSSGYSADVDATANNGNGVSSAPPGCIDVDSSRQSSKRFAIPEVKPLYKRCKPTPEENQYNVARVYDDLAAGNMEIQKVQPSRPRIFRTFNPTFPIWNLPRGQQCAHRFPLLVPL
jgi:hypothetical protein